MTKIKMQRVCVDYPVYNVNGRSLKKKFLRLATGGAVVRDANERFVVNALSDIDLDLVEGDRVGLIGHNGAGKSTMLRLLAGIYEPSSGSILRSGRISPMLNLMQGIEGEFTGYENIVQRGVMLGLTKKQIQEHIDEIAELTGLGDYLSMPARTYSSGMLVRLAFAITTSIDPEILLIDEVFNAGDAAFMEKARVKMISLMDKSSIVVMANHSDGLIREFCQKGLLLEAGRVKFFGPVEEALRLYHGT